MIYAQRDLYDLYLKGDFDENPRWVRSIYFPARWENGNNWLVWQYKDQGELQGYSGGEKYIDLDVLNPHKSLDDIRIK
jgi:lysozyme